MIFYQHKSNKFNYNSKITNQKNKNKQLQPEVMMIMNVAFVKMKNKELLYNVE